jgi:outer membrane protein
MKKIILLVLTLGFSWSTYAQKIAFIESEFILDKVSSYKIAKEKLDKQSLDWQKEIEGKMKELDVLYKKFQSEQALYTEQMKQDKIAEVEKKEKEVSEMQKQRFGPNGDVFKKRQELIQPIINQMFDEVKKIAESKGYDLVLDKNNGNSIVYNNSKLNISDQVVKAMGY